MFADRVEKHKACRMCDSALPLLIPPYHSAINNELLSYDRQRCSGHLHLFTLLCLHLTFTLNVSFLLNHLHQSQKHFPD